MRIEATSAIPVHNATTFWYFGTLGIAPQTFVCIYYIILKLIHALAEGRRLTQTFSAAGCPKMERPAPVSIEMVRS
jgi:uncharacterized membrane protein